MSEWSMEMDCKSIVEKPRGFKSHFLQNIFYILIINEKALVTKEKEYKKNNCN